MGGHKVGAACPEHSEYNIHIELVECPQSAERLSRDGVYHLGVGWGVLA